MPWHTLQRLTGLPSSLVRNSIPNVAGEDLPPFDFVVVTTKNVADVPPLVADVIAPAVTPGHTAITLLQNGLNIERPIIAAFPTNPVISGITAIGAREHPRGSIKHTNYVRLEFVIRIILPFSLMCLIYLPSLPLWVKLKY